MTLSELVETLSEYGGAGVIYIEKNNPWSAVSSVLIFPDEPDPDEAALAQPNYEYFLEIYLAEEVIQVWKDWRSGREPNNAEKCAAIVHYAKNDAYLPI